MYMPFCRHFCQKSHVHTFYICVGSGIKRTIITLQALRSTNWATKGPPKIQEYTISQCKCTMNVANKHNDQEQNNVCGRVCVCVLPIQIRNQWPRQTRITSNGSLYFNSDEGKASVQNATDMASFNQSISFKPDVTDMSHSSLSPFPCCKWWAV